MLERRALDDGFGDDSEGKLIYKIIYGGSGSSAGTLRLILK
jgi:hypothetical protein